MPSASVAVNNHRRQPRNGLLSTNIARPKTGALGKWRLVGQQSLQHGVRTNNFCPRKGLETRSHLIYEQTNVFY